MPYAVMLWRGDSSLERRRAGPAVAGRSGARSRVRLPEPSDGHDDARLGPAAASPTLTFGDDLRGNLTKKTSDVAADTDVTGYDYSSVTSRLSSANLSGVARAYTHDASVHSGEIRRLQATARRPAGADDTFIAWIACGLATAVTLGATADDSSPTARDVVPQRAMDPGAPPRSDDARFGYRTVNSRIPE